ncbi:hypothetical protein [Flavisphingomonas formosensis]|uniref:hypothetical protein n=1 Tax=Flavisphingomonas formosensis TaxID=861534 RepID=UPI0012F8A6FE|nr:hypothetical protein [Sphingomonas formosensis]
MAEPAISVRDKMVLESLTLLMSHPIRSARLDARLIRRRETTWTPDWAEIPSDELRPAPSDATWRDDLQLFLTAWAFGFVFFLAFLL